MGERLGANFGDVLREFALRLRLLGQAQVGLVPSIQNVVAASTFALGLQISRSQRRAVSYLVVVQP